MQAWPLPAGAQVDADAQGVPRLPVIFDYASTADQTTPRSTLEQAEAIGTQQPLTQPDHLTKAEVLAEGLRLVRAASPQLRALVLDFVQRELVTDNWGKPRRAADVGCRTLALLHALRPSFLGSGAAAARGAGVTRAYMCKLSKQLVARYGFVMPANVMPPNQEPRGAAMANHLRRLDRRRDLERQADDLLTAAGVTPWKAKAPGDSGDVDRVA